METVVKDWNKPTQEEIRSLWNELADVPMNPETEKLEEPFFLFEKGTDKLDIWAWFDDRYDYGVYSLLYCGGKKAGVSIVADKILDIDETETKLYNADSTISFGGTTDLKLSASEIIRKALTESGFTHSSLGKILGCTGQNISNKLRRNTLSADEFVSWLDIMGFDVTVTCRKTARNIEDIDFGTNHRIRYIKRVVDGKYFNNRTADVVANTFQKGVDGVFDENGRASELYRISDGTYILVEYGKEPGSDIVSIVPKTIADMFVNVYGTVDGFEVQ